MDQRTNNDNPEKKRGGPFRSLDRSYENYYWRDSQLWDMEKPGQLKSKVFWWFPLSIFKLNKFRTIAKGLVDSLRDQRAGLILGQRISIVSLPCYAASLLGSFAIDSNA